MGWRGLESVGQRLGLTLWGAAGLLFAALLLPACGSQSHPNGYPYARARLLEMPEASLRFTPSRTVRRIGYEHYNNPDTGEVPGFAGFILGTDASAQQVLAWYQQGLETVGWQRGKIEPGGYYVQGEAFEYYRGHTSFKVGIFSDFGKNDLLTTQHIAQAKDFPTLVNTELGWNPSGMMDGITQGGPSPNIYPTPLPAPSGTP
jgi:hypothetical protein